jgi:hypothetical protein
MRVRRHVVENDNRNGRAQQTKRITIRANNSNNDKIATTKNIFVY